MPSLESLTDFVLKCHFNRVAMQLCWGHFSACVFSPEFTTCSQGTLLCWSTYRGIRLSFAKTWLFFIVHLKGTVTCCYNCFVCDSQSFNILQLMSIICKSSFICLSCVHNLELHFFDNRVRSKKTLSFSFLFSCFIIWNDQLQEAFKTVATKVMGI